MSRASVDRVDEDRVRKVAADNPDLLHCRLAQRFGISVHRLRTILGVGAGELLNPKQLQHYTPRPGLSHAGRYDRERLNVKRQNLRKKLRAEENQKRTAWERGGPLD